MGTGITFEQYRKLIGATVAPPPELEPLDPARSEFRKRIRDRLVKGHILKPSVPDETPVGQLIYRHFIQQYGLVNHHISSFEDFILHGFESHVLAVTPRIEIKCQDGRVEAYFCNPYLMPPCLIDDGKSHLTTPNECLVRKTTYAAPLFGDWIITKYPTEGRKTEVVKTNMMFCMIPVCVGSRWCATRSRTSDPASIRSDPEDPGGYFIVNGVKKILVTSEKLLMNVPYVFAGTQKVKCDWFCEIRSRLANDTQVVIQVMMMPKMFFVVRSAQFAKNQAIPFGIVMQLFGINLDKFKTIVKKNWSRLTSTAGTDLSAVLELMFDRNAEYTRQYSVESSRDYVSRYLMPDVTVDQFTADFMPHISTLREKGEMLCYMVQLTMLVGLGVCEPTNRDHYANKRIENTGALLRQIARRNVVQLYRSIENKYNDTSRRRGPILELVGVLEMLKPPPEDPVSRGFRYALSTGNWNTPGASEQTVNVGVAQLYLSLSKLHNSHIVTVPTNKSGQQVNQRKLHGSSWGFLCPADTPEGAACGLTKNMSLSALLTLEHDSTGVLKRLERDLVSVDVDSDGAYVFVNGSLVGVVANPETVIESLKHERRFGMITPFTSIVFDERTNQVRIRTDAGRICRPVLIVNDSGEIVLTRDDILAAEASNSPFTYYLENGLIEFLDPAEQETTVIAVSEDALKAHPRPRYTHCEIDAALMYSRAVANVPYATHNQAPRITYQASMGRQSCGIPTMAWQHETEGLVYVMHYLQRPLCSSEYCDMLGFNEAPPCFNVMWAVSARGDNQEDAVLIKKGFIERGGGRVTLFMTHLRDNKTMDVGPIKRAPYLDVNGLPEIGQILNNGDIVIGEPAPRDCITIKTIIPQRVERVVLTTNDSGILAEVVTSELRTPTIGDKFAARYGQKGVEARMIADEDLPVDPVTGETPDILMNCQGFPSRMTIGMFLECLFSCLALEFGGFMDATAYRRPYTANSAETADAERALLIFQLMKLGVDQNYIDTLDWDAPGSPEAVREVMKKIGSLARCDRLMMNGKTGKMIGDRMFMGVMTYQRLRHMTLSKIQARARGQVQKLTRQPVEGRAQGGGLRFGEMERDCGISYGGSSFLLERFMELTDRNTSLVCPKCGLLSTAIKIEKYIVCDKCTQEEDPACRDCRITQSLMCKMCMVDLVPVNMPYGAKLLFQELMAMGVAPHIAIAPGGK